MKKAEKVIKKELERLFRNCMFYEEEGEKEKLYSEIGALRGAMQIAMALEIEFPFIYYGKFVRPDWERLNNK